MFKTLFMCLALAGFAQCLPQPCDLVYKIRRPGSDLCHLALGGETDEFFFHDARQRIPYKRFWSTALRVKEQCPEQSEELIRGLKYMWRGNAPRWVEMYANGDGGVLPLLLHLWQSWNRNRDILTIFSECPTLMESKLHDDILDHFIQNP